ncbi:MAG: PspC domain-containing protein [Sphingomonadales bacterium]
MHGSRQSLFTRDDTFFGVCEAIGQDFGFNANILRVAFGVLLLWNPVVIISAYLGLGVIVAASRWLYPDTPRKPRRSKAAAAGPVAAAAEPGPQEREGEPEDLAIAA